MDSLYIEGQTYIATKIGVIKEKDSQPYRRCNQSDHTTCQNVLSQGQS